jgi:hypothetical protein
MSVFTDHVPLSPFLLIVAGLAVWTGLRYLKAILVMLSEIKLAVESQPKYSSSPVDIFMRTEVSPPLFELFTRAQRKDLGLDK